LDQLLTDEPRTGVERMAVTDRNVLQLGFEILFTETPRRRDQRGGQVSGAGTRQSAHFVNGILDKFMQGRDTPGMTMSWFDLIKAGLKDLASPPYRYSRPVQARGRIVDDAFLTDLFAIMVKTDMGVGPAERFATRSDRIACKKCC
jgi:hypothetical protein